MPQFVQSTAPDGTSVVRVAGEVDLWVIEDLKAAVRGSLSDNTTVDLDLTELEFIDSSGLGALVQLLKEAAGNGCTFRLTNVGASTYRLLEASGLARVFDVRRAAEDPDDAAGA